MCDCAKKGNMTVDELIKKLEQMRDRHGPDTPVKFIDGNWFNIIRQITGKPFAKINHVDYDYCAVILATG